MPALITPTTCVQESFLAAMDEFRAEGRGPGDGSMIGHDIGMFGSSWHSPGGFMLYVQYVRAQAREDAPRPAHYVPSTTLWWVESGEYLGRVAIRHRLTSALVEVGGHVGYDVRASARRQGHATAMLAAALPIANRLGIDPALVTCDSTNLASRTVIQRNGGVLDDERHGGLRFWVPTGSGYPQDR
jgi:predicted acetyltransferase